jgi:DNA primase
MRPYNIDSTTYAFPYDYFLETSKTDEVVFITEGEKDALNLLSYDINVLTLGGVSSSWTPHKKLLKDKIVYIWFDNDNTGYESAIKRYNEIVDIAKEVYITLFYHINSSLPSKYDIADFIKDQKFKDKTELMHSIAYSSYKLTTSLIEDIEDYTQLDLKSYYFNQPIKKFSEIKKEWLKKDKDNIPLNITTAKGEKDIKGLEQFFIKYKEHKNTEKFKQIKETILNTFVTKDNDNENEIIELVDMFDGMVSNSDTLYKDYRQTHISDMVTSFEAMAKRTDNTFAKFNGTLAIWTGNYYHILDEKIDDIKRFILKGWMPLARVDKKKHSSANVDKILEDVYTGAVSINEIKDNQKGTRVINFANGTLFITKKVRLHLKISTLKQMVLQIY